MLCVCTVNDVVKDLTGEPHSIYNIDTDQTINIYKSRLQLLTDYLNVLKDELIKQTKYCQLQNSSIVLINQQYTTFYVSSSIRSTLLASYSTAQYVISEQYKQYSESIQQQCIKPLDEWQNDNIDIVEQLNQLINATQHCHQLNEKLNKLKRQVQVNETNHEKLQLAVQQSEQQYTKYSAALNKMRDNVTNKINDYLSGRFTRSDEIFLDYIQLQYNYYTSITQSLQNIPATIELYKKQIAAEKLQRQTQPNPSNTRQSSDSINNKSINSKNSNSNSSNDKSYQNGNKLSSNNNNKQPQSQYQSRPLVHTSESDTTDHGDSDSDPYETASDSDGDINYNTTQPAHTTRSSSDVADILNFSGTSIHNNNNNNRTAPINNNNKQKSVPLQPQSHHSNTFQKSPTQPSTNTDPLFDFFSPTSTSSQHKLPTPTNTNTTRNHKNNKNQSSVPDFFTANDTTNNTTTSEPTFNFTSPQQPSRTNTTTSTNPPGNGMHTSKSYNESIHRPRNTTTKGFDSFDPFDSFNNNKQSSSHNDIDDHDTTRRAPSASMSDNSIHAQHSTAATTGQPINSLSDTSPYSLPYHDFQIEDKLSAWEKTPSNQIKHIRILLCTLQSVLWNNSNWNNIDINELNDYNTIKKCHRKAILSVHPDKLVNAPSQTKLVAQHVFATLNTAFQLFDKSARQGQLGF